MRPCSRDTATTAHPGTYDTDTAASTPSTRVRP
jgi:hypothetical protein